MKWPFLSLEKPDFRPHRQFGLDPTLSKDTVGVYEALDVIQQQGEWNIDRSIEHRFWLGLLWLLFIAINGTQILFIFNHWVTGK